MVLWLTLVDQSEPVAHPYEKEKLLKNAKGEAGDAASEVSGLQRLLKLRTRELANIRRLASEVVRQRGDVERFLIDSLENVKKEIVDERVRDNQTTSSGSLPSLGRGGGPGGEGGSGRSKPSRQGSGRGLDISDLGWEDRERVLRLLFSKINSASQASYFAKLPPHSFDVEVRGGTGMSEGGMSGVMDPSGMGMGGMGSSPLGGVISDGYQPGLM